jgi:hypothetical protein
MRSHRVRNIPDATTSPRAFKDALATRSPTQSSRPNSNARSPTATRCMAIAQLIGQQAAAFVLDPDGVTRTKPRGSDRVARRLSDTLPGGNIPLRAPVWEFLRPMLSPTLANCTALECGAELPAFFVAQYSRSCSLRRGYAARGHKAPRTSGGEFGTTDGRLATDKDRNSCPIDP